MEQYHITGMSCAACSSRVEKAVKKVEGVAECSVSLLTNSMGVTGTASEGDIIRAVEQAGYGASMANSKEEAPTDSRAEPELGQELIKLKQRLFSSLVFLALLMYLSMGHMMFGWPLPAALAQNHVALGICQMLLTISIMVINQRFFVSGFKSLWHRAPNMDTLVALGAGAAFVYSTYALFAMTDAQMYGDMKRVMAYGHEFYFESAAMILTLITVGKMLEARSKGKTTDALKGLMKLAAKTAVIINNGVEETVSIDRVKKGDTFVVRPGENIPVDGVILDGNTAVNESSLTGESIPADKGPGDFVSAGTINLSGFMRCEASRVGEDTTLSQIIKMVSDAAATKAPIAKVADRVSGVFVPVVIGIAAVTFLVWMLSGGTPGYSLARAISVLVISCPCALGLATPVAIMVGNGVGARNGIMFKTAAALEETGKVSIVALDKTGTITRGEPRVTAVLPGEDYTEEELLEIALSLEQYSEHPLAKAVLFYGEERRLAGEEISVLPATGFKALPGNGLTAKMDGVSLFGGNEPFIQERADIPLPAKERGGRLSLEGNTPLYFAKGGKFAGIIAVADVIKEEAPLAVSELKNMGIRVVMLTGDNERTAKAIGAKAGVDEVIAGVLPDGKERVIQGLKQQGKTAMVGDGINDAPALTSADMGIAIGAGTDIAIDAADVVLMKSRLTDVPAAIRLSRAALRNIHENLFWAFIYNVIGIPLAAGVWIPFFGLTLNPMFGAAAMSLSSFCVVTNALRLNFKNTHDAGRDKKIKQNKKKEVNDMTKTMNIEGMMCEHCEARVKKVLEALAGVERALVSHEEGTAVVTLGADVSDDELRKAVEEQDYKVLSIR